MLNKFNYFIKQYINLFDIVFNGIQEKKKKKSIYAVVFAFINVIVCIFFFYKIVKGIETGIYTSGFIVVYSSALIYLCSCLNHLMEDISMYVDTLDYMEQFFGFLNASPNIKNDGTLILKDSIRLIEFKNVSFHYPTTEDEV